MKFIGTLLYGILIVLLALLSLGSFAQLFIVMDLPYVHETFALVSNLGNYLFLASFVCMSAVILATCRLIEGRDSYPRKLKTRHVDSVYWTRSEPGKRQFNPQDVQLDELAQLEALLAQADRTRRAGEQFLRDLPQHPVNHDWDASSLVGTSLMAGTPDLSNQYRY